MNLILFDIDGTLVDSTDFDTALYVYVEAVQEVLSIKIDQNWVTYKLTGKTKKEKLPN